jgi:hypothetical protein
MLVKPTFWKLLDSNLLTEEFVVNTFVCKPSEIYWKKLCLIITCVSVFKGVFKGPSPLLTKIFLLFTWHWRLPWQKLSLGGIKGAYGVVLLFIKKLGVWCLACINNTKMHGNRGKSGFVRLFWLVKSIEYSQSPHHGRIYLFICWNLFIWILGKVLHEGIMDFYWKHDVKIHLIVNAWWEKEALIVKARWKWFRHCESMMKMLQRLWKHDEMLKGQVSFKYRHCNLSLITGQKLPHNGDSRKFQWDGIRLLGWSRTAMHWNLAILIHLMK